MFNDYSSQFRGILLTVVEGVEELHSRRNSEEVQKISKFAKLMKEGMI